MNKMHQALSEFQTALVAQEKMIDELLDDDGDERNPGFSTPVPDPDPTSREALSHLTTREREVLVLVSRGNSNRRVASSLGISEKTVRNHLSAVFSKVGAADRTQAVVMGIRSGIVAIDENVDHGLRPHVRTSDQN
ncbi:LuxR C-terminal-related transcriptional regulator [Streptomyces sp. NPDC050704]|uniref:response regulator transcription factor n=1 Tax=Streptomyces sp. NPDC050704 TaxID=3157219 RepID=UPI003445856B